MEKTTLVAIAILALLLVGAIFVSAEIFQKSNAEKTTQNIVESVNTPCGCGCNGNCGGSCGSDECICGR
jgi:hypothetical protein